MKSLKQYANEEKKKAYKKRHRQKNYEKGSIWDKKRNKPYTTKDCSLVLLHTCSDRELAKMLGRSVRAIQVLRCRLKKRG